jgi:FAD/FMN-containing dehydrogenase
VANTLKVDNWSRNVVTDPAAFARPTTVEEVRSILTDRENYPSPVRAFGHYHSTTRCAQANGGTLVEMTGMNRVLEITDTHVRAEAGAIYLDVLRMLVAKGLNFFVDLQVGNVTLGSMACCDSKDGSYPDIYGQFGAYLSHMKLVRPDGDVIDIDDSDPELFAAARSSYGLFGIVVEVTFRIRRLEPISIRHRNYSTTEFIERLPQFFERDGSMMMYLFPFAERVTVQLRGPGDPNRRRNRWLWPLRNFGVADAVALYSRFLKLIPFASLRYALLGMFDAIARFVLAAFLHAKNTRPSDQATDYKHRPRLAYFNFSIFAFPEPDYPRILMAYQAFCRDHYRTYRYRPDLLTVGYRVKRCRYSLLSYSYDGNVMTIDPVGTGGPEWDRFLDEFNKFAARNGGIPLFNQSPRLRRDAVERVLGERWAEFRRIRTAMDPDDRMLNDYFRELLG